MKEIRMVDLLGQYSKIKEKLDYAMQDVIENAVFINGPQVGLFANELADFLHVKHVIPCANGTDALQIALMALDLPRGAEIIVPTFNYVATAEVIALLGFKPVFIDSSVDNYNLLIGAIEAAITENTRAIMPVHIFGQCVDMLTVLKIAQKYNLYVIEDAAQAIGSKCFFPDGTERFAGTIGHIGTTSFFPSKNLGCMGDGGAIFTNDDAFAKKIKAIANHGQSTKYNYDEIGVNSRLDTLQAAILRVKLTNLSTYNQSRIDAASFYTQFLEAYPFIETPRTAHWTSHVFHQYTLQVDANQRDGLKKFLETKNIPTMIYYPLPLHLHKAYQYLGYKEGDFPNAENISKKVISLPMHTELDNEQLLYICNSIIEYFKN